MQRATGRSSGNGQAHRHTNQTDWLRDVILGGQDGLVNILGIILGVIAGGGSRVVLLSAGFAAAFTESVSMGAVGYTSTVADRDYYEAQRRLEEAEIHHEPELERQELRELYEAKGFSGDLLDRVVETITSNRENWLGTILDDERHLQPVQSSDIFRSSVVITVATFIGHLIPLFPFLFLDRAYSLVLGFVLAAIVLFGVGAYSAVTRVGVWWKIGLRMVVIGMGAAGVGFLIGHLFHA